MTVCDTTVMVDISRMMAKVHVYCTIILHATTNSTTIMLTIILIIIVIRVIVNIIINIGTFIMDMIGTAIVPIITIIIIIIIIFIIIIIIIVIQITWLTTLHCNRVRVYSLCLDSPKCFGLAALVFLPTGRPRLRDGVSCAMVGLWACSMPEALLALSLSVGLNMRRHATFGSLYRCWSGELENIAIFTLFVVQ